MLSFGYTPLRISSCRKNKKSFFYCLVNFMPLTVMILCLSSLRPTKMMPPVLVFMNPTMVLVR